MKNIILLLALLMSGCASMGHHLANAGQKTGKTGTGALMLSGVCPLLLPVSLPCLAFGATLYYPGCLIAHDKPEKRPFEL